MLFLLLLTRSYFTWSPSGTSDKPLSLSGTLYLCFKRRPASFQRSSEISAHFGKWLSINMELSDIAPSLSHVDGVTGTLCQCVCLPYLLGLKLHPCRHILWGHGFAASPHSAIHTQVFQDWILRYHSLLSEKDFEAGLSILLCRKNYFSLTGTVSSIAEMT